MLLLKFKVSFTLLHILSLAQVIKIPLLPKITFTKLNSLVLDTSSKAAIRSFQNIVIPSLILFLLFHRVKFARSKISLISSDSLKNENDIIAILVGWNWCFPSSM